MGAILFGFLFRSAILKQQIVNYRMISNAINGTVVHDGHVSHGTIANPPISQQTPLHLPSLSMRQCNAQWRR